jgi:hypothetical protein
MVKKTATGGRKGGNTGPVHPRLSVGLSVGQARLELVTWGEQQNSTVISYYLKKQTNSPATD